MDQKNEKPVAASKPEGSEVKDVSAAPLEVVNADNDGKEVKPNPFSVTRGADTVKAGEEVKSVGHVEPDAKPEDKKEIK